MWLAQVAVDVADVVRNTPWHSDRLDLLDWEAPNLARGAVPWPWSSLCCLVCGQTRLPAPMAPYSPDFEEAAERHHGESLAGRNAKGQFGLEFASPFRVPFGWRLLKQKNCSIFQFRHTTQRESAHSNVFQHSFFPLYPFVPTPPKCPAPRVLSQLQVATVAWFHPPMRNCWKAKVLDRSWSMSLPLGPSFKNTRQNMPQKRLQNPPYRHNPKTSPEFFGNQVALPIRRLPFWFAGVRGSNESKEAELNRTTCGSLVSILTSSSFPASISSPAPAAWSSFTLLSFWSLPKSFQAPRWLHLQSLRSQVCL